MQLLIAPTPNSLTVELLRVYAKSSGEAALGKQRLWLVRDAAQAARIVAQLAGAASGVLTPGVKPLHQAADAVLSSLAPPTRPLSSVAKAQLIEEVLERGKFSGRLRLLASAQGTAGGVDYVAAAFRQFALQDCGPGELLDRPAIAGDPRLRQLALAYKDYRAELHKHRLMDREARLEHACRLCESGAGLPHGLDLLVASGCDSLSPLEWRFVNALAGRAADCWVALTIGEPPSGFRRPAPDTPSPYANTSEQVRILSTRYPDAQVHWIDSALAPDDPRREALANLFRDPRDAAQAAPAAPARRTLTLHAARSPQDEAEAAARYAKRLLLAGVKPDDIVVATRSVGEWSARLLEAFDAAGVALAVEGALPFGASRWARAAALVLRLAANDWPHDAVHSVVTLPALKRFDSPLSDDEWKLARRLGFAGRRAAVEWVVNELACPKGRRVLLDRVAWLASRHALPADQAESDDKSLSRWRDRMSAAASLAHEPLRRLAEISQRLDPASDPLGWHDRIVSALQALEYRQASGVGRAAQQDAAAIDAMEEAFASIARLAAWRGEQQATLPLTEVARLVRGWLSRVQLDLRWESEARVRLLSAESACETPVRRLLVMGLDEQSFPRPDASLAVGGDDTQPLRHQSTEMLLFCKLLAAATDSVRLTYTAFDERGQALNPSSYVAELERVLPAGALRAEPQEGAEAQEAADEEAGFVEPQGLRRSAVRKLLEGDAGELAGLAASQRGRGVAESIAAGLLAGLERHSGERFGAYEGVLLSDEARQVLAARFGPEHLWSASQLELYGQCPFKFFMRDVLRADPAQSLTLDIDYRRRGSLLHDAMARFHRRVNDLVEQGAATSTLDADAFAAAFSAAVDESFRALATATHEQAVAEVEALQAAAWSDGYRRQHERYDMLAKAFDEPLLPAHFEARFGPAISSHDGPQEPLSTPEPFRFLAGDHEVLLTGQIDRIDVGRVAGQTVFNIIDYKTSKSLTLKQADVESGRLLQLVLYTLAVSDHLMAGQGVAPWRSGYWAVQDGGFKTGNLPQPGQSTDGMVTVADEWDVLVQSVRERVGQIVRDVRDARFPMFNLDEDCGGRCEYRTVCRVAQARSLGKRPDGGAE